MTVSVDNNQSRNVFGKAVPSQISKGALIGAGVGATAQGAWLAILGKGLFSIPTKDEFLKQNIERITTAYKKQPKEVLEEAISRMKSNAENDYARLVNHIKRLKSNFIKKGALSIGKQALIIGAVGAAIGGIVYFVKKGKASKEAKNQQVNK